MADPDPRPDAVAPASAEADSADAWPAPPMVTAERVGTEAVLLRFNLTDGSLDLGADEDEEPMGGDAACWAHLFEEQPEKKPEGNDR